MKILVTGGAGFIGLHTVEQLLMERHQVAVVDHLENGTKTFPLSEAKLYQLDIGSEEMAEVFARERPDAVIHLAAQISVQRSLESPGMDARNNILGTINLLKQCVDYQVPKFIFASSAAVYGSASRLPIREDHVSSPLSFYGASKRMAEEYIQLFAEIYGLDYTILRYANVFGMRQSSHGESGVVAMFVRRMLEGKELLVYGTGWQTRDFVFVKDVARANLAALTRGSRAILNVGSGRQTSINGLLRLLSNVSGQELEPAYREARAGDIHDSLLDSRKAAEQLGWEPSYSVLDGLREMVEYEAAELQARAPEAFIAET